MNNMDASAYKECALSAARSKLAYLGPDDVNALWCNSQNDTNNILFYVFNNVTKAPLYYYDSVSHVNAYSWVQWSTLHIVFRGTEGMDDAKIDLMIEQSQLLPGNKSLKVHSGFLKQFRSIQSELLDTIVGGRELGIKTVHFSGHSLGAALATLASGYFSPLIRDISGCQIICHTFGSPRIGNSAFVDWWTDKVDISCRFLNYKDPVPLLPLNGFYKHINGGFEIYKNGLVKELSVDVPWYVRLLTLPFNIKCLAPIQNHACNLYIERLVALAQWDVVNIIKVDPRINVDLTNK